MELFPFIESGTPLLLSASESGLFVYPMKNEHFGHPFLLCSGYKNGFSGCLYNDSLYYTYTNKEDSLLLRRLHESTLLFRLDRTETVVYLQPQLICFNNTLFLFYFESAQGSFHLKVQLPFSGQHFSLPEPLCTSYPELPTLSLLTTGHYLYLFLSVGTSTLSYRYSPVTYFEPVHTEADLLSSLRLPWETEKAQLEQALLRAVHLSEQQQNLLSEKEQKLQLNETRFTELTSEAEHTQNLLSETTEALRTVQAQLAECEQNRHQTSQELEHVSLLLERAKVQYNELMQVAEQYRQEALKWYGKFTDRI